MTATTELAIEGMCCDGCVQRVAKALHGVHGVEEARVDLARRRATVCHDPVLAGERALARAVTEAGCETRIARGTAPVPAGARHGSAGCCCG